MFLQLIVLASFALFYYTQLIAGDNSLLISG